MYLIYRDSLWPLSPFVVFLGEYAQVMLDHKGDTKQSVVSQEDDGAMLDL